MNKAAWLKDAEWCFEYMTYQELGNPDFWECRMYQSLFRWAGWRE